MLPFFHAFYNKFVTFSDSKNFRRKNQTFFKKTDILAEKSVLKIYQCFKRIQWHIRCDLVQQNPNLENVQQAKSATLIVQLASKRKENGCGERKIFPQNINTEENIKKAALL